MRVLLPCGLVMMSIAAHCSADPTADRETVLRRFRQACDARRWPAAIAAGRQLAALEPASAGIHYNLACVYAQSGDAAAGVNSLKRAGDAGFALMTTFFTDTDLDPLRDHPDYPAALARIRQNHLTQFAAFRARAEREARVLTFLPPRYDKSRPAALIVALHGSGGVADQMVDVWRPIASRLNAILICPQGMLPLGGGFSWGKVEDGEHLVLRAVERACAEHKVDRARIVLTGFSQGASQSFITGMRHGDLFAAVIPVVGHYAERVAPIRPYSDVAAGRLDPLSQAEADAPATEVNGSAAESKGVQSADSSRRGTAAPPRWTIFCGASDEEADNNRRAASLLREAGYPVDLRIYPGGHTWPPNASAALTRSVESALHLQTGS